MSRVWITLCAALLGGCQSADFVRPEVPVPDTWSHLGAESSAATAAASLADRPWVEVLPLPELTALIDEALAGSSDLRIAVERIELARAQYGLERAAMFPGIDLAGSATRQRAPGRDPAKNTIGESSGLALAVPAWEIDLWGRLADRTEVARREVLASEAAAQGVRISLVADVSARYLDLLDLDNQLEISHRTLESRRQSLRLTRARFDEGISSIVDVRQAESLLASSEVALADQRRRLAQAENSLAVLLGRNPGSIERHVRLDAIELPATMLAGIPSALLPRRPDIQAAEERLRGAHANVAAARKAYLPSLSLTTTLGLASPDVGGLSDSGRHAWSVQPAATLPLFTAGALGSAVALAESQQRILVEQYKATIRQAFREVNDALVALEQLGAQRAASRNVVLANRERLRVTKSRYVGGITSYFEVLDAERQLFDSELSLSQSTRALHQALVQLYLALGGGWRGTA